MQQEDPFEQPFSLQKQPQQQFQPNLQLNYYTPTQGISRKPDPVEPSKFDDNLVDEKLTSKKMNAKVEETKGEIQLLKKINSSYHQAEILDSPVKFCFCD